MRHLNMLAGQAGHWWFLVPEMLFDACVQGAAL